MSKNLRMWAWRFKPSLLDTLMLTFLCLNLATLHFVTYIWKLDLVYYSLIVFAVSLIFSISIQSLKKSFLFIFISLVVGLIISLGFVSIPPFIYVGGAMTSFIIEVYVVNIIKTAILSVPTSMFAVLLGSVLSDGI